MTDNTNTKSKRELEAENEGLRIQQQDLLERVARMEAHLQGATPAVDPAPVMFHDPYDMETNPHYIKKHPEGKRLSWKNPVLRNTFRGWRGWTPITYDDEIGQNLSEYIVDPPAKMAGAAEQDNYVRRGTDSILCWIKEEIWQARQLKREHKALRDQQAASASQNTMLRPGVSTFGKGVEREDLPPDGMKQGREPRPSNPSVPFHRTELMKE